jgi:hypothetical protein
MGNTVVVWKGSIRASYIPVLEDASLKFEDLEITVEEFKVIPSGNQGTEAMRGDILEWGMNTSSLRLLEIGEGMEAMQGVMAIVGSTGWSPRRELFTEEAESLTNDRCTESSCR